MFSPEAVAMSDEISISTENESSVELYSDSNSEGHDELELPQSLKLLSLKSTNGTKAGHQQNRSFSRSRVIEIERHNLALMRRINSAKSTINHSHNGAHIECGTMTSSAAINRKKVQQKVEYENSILRRKLETIGRRRHSISF